MKSLCLHTTGMSTFLLVGQSSGTVRYTILKPPTSDTLLEPLGQHLCLRKMEIGEAIWKDLTATLKKKKKINESRMLKAGMSKL